jgi:DNA-binding GntR family transcriptional regulator
VRFPTLESHDWSQDESLYKVLSDEYEINISAMDHTIKPVAITETEARYLKAQAGIPALLSQIIAYTPGGAPVEYAWSVAHGDKSEFYFHFQRTE